MLRRYEDVVALDIAMYNSVLVQVCNGKRGLIELNSISSATAGSNGYISATYYFATIRIGVPYEVAACGAVFHKWRNEVNPDRDLADTKEFQDVRVIKTTPHLPFLLVYKSIRN